MINPFSEIDLRLSNIESLLLDIKHGGLNPSPPTEPADRWFNVDELINYLPDRPARQTIYGKVSSNEIPHYKDSKKLRFLKAEIDLWLKQGRKKTSLELQTDIETATDTFLSKRKQSIKN